MLYNKTNQYTSKGRVSVSEQPFLRSADIIRNKEDYTVSDIAYFARDILLKDDDANDIYGDNPGIRTSWLSSDGQVELSGSKLDEQRSAFQMEVDDPQRLGGRHIYTINDNGQNAGSTVALFDENHQQINHTYIENVITVMNILRTHPTVSEPLMNKIGRERLRYIQDALALVVGVDKQLPQSKDTDD